MDYNITTDKYYDRTDEDSYKGIKRLLFRAGEILQNTEVNEIQSLLHDQLKELSEEFIANGQVIEGADIDILYNSEPYIPSRIFEPKSIQMNSDGSKMYVLNTSVNAIYEFDLASQYNISTATYNHKKFDMSRYEAQAKDFGFSEDGTHLFTIGKQNTELHQFSMDDGFDVSKSKYKTKTKLHELNPPINKAVNFQFGNNGSSLYVLDENENDEAQDGYYKQYSLSNSYDIDTISPNNTTKHLKVKKSEADKDDPTVAGDFRPSQMKFNGDGKQMFLLGTHSKAIQKFELGSAYDLSTSNFNSFYYDVSNTFNIANVNEPTGMTFDNDGKYITVVGSDNSINYQKELTVEYDFTSTGAEAEYDTEQETLEVELRCGAGNIYFSEFFNEIEETTLSLGVKTLTAIESINDEIGILLEFQEDSSLRDPAVEYDNFGQSGAYGLRFITEWKLNSTVQAEGIDVETQEFIPIYKIVNGEIFPIVEISPLQKKIIDVSAKYDRNSNGNYVVGGYYVTYVDAETGVDTKIESGPFNFDVGEGSVNVYGYNYEAYSAQNIQLPEMNSTLITDNDPVTFSSGDGFYDLDHTPVYEVSSVVGQLYYTIDYSGTIEDTTLFVHNNTYSILSVIQKTTLTELVLGEDYTIDGNSINIIGLWENGIDIESTYNETYLNLESATGTEIGAISDDYVGVYLSGFYAGTTVNVSYTSMLPRIDTIIVDSLGDIGYIQGVPSEYYPSANKTIDKARQLSLAEVLLVYGQQPIVTITGQRVYEMKDLSHMASNIVQNEYNISKLALVVNLMNSNPTASLVNTFVDDFRDNRNRYQLDPGNAECIAGNLVLDTTWNTYDIETEDLLLTDIPGNSTTEKEYFALISSKDALALLEQKWYSKSRLINEYMFRAPPEVVLDVHPRVYRWVSKTNYKEYVRSVQENDFNRLRENSVDADWSHGENRWNIWWGRWNWSGTHALVKNDREHEFNREEITREAMRSTVDSTTTVGLSETKEIIPPISLRLRSGFGAFNSNEEIEITFDGEVISETIDDVGYTHGNIIMASIDDDPVTVTFVNAGASITPDIVVTGNDIVVTLETNGSSEIISTEYETTYALSNNTSASLLMSTELSESSSGSDVTTALAVTTLDENVWIPKTFHADFDGTLDEKFNIPDNHYSGVKDISASAPSGAQGSTIFEAIPLVKDILTRITDYWRRVRTRYRLRVRLDPIAQSFVLQETKSVDGIKVYFDDLPDTETTMVLTEVVNGFPNVDRTMVTKTLQPNEIDQSDDGLYGNSGTYFEFDSKVVLEKDKEFAFIVMCNDAKGKLRCARLGDKVKEKSDGQEFWMTSQAYNIGVLYNSSNNSAWTPIQEEDIKFQIAGCTYENDRTIDFPAVAVTDACDILLLANTELDQNTNVTFSAVVNKGEVNEKVYDIVPYSPYSLELDTKYTGDVHVSATLTSSDGFMSPKLDPSMQLATASIDSDTDSIYTSDYFKFEPGDNEGHVQVYLDQYSVAGKTTVVVEYDDTLLIQGQEGWVENWIELPVNSLKNVKNSWQEVEYKSVSTVTKPVTGFTRVRVRLQTNDILIRPVVGNLRASIQINIT